MPITTNSGGVLHNLSPIYVRNGAVLNEFSKIYARNGAVLSTIYEKDSGGGGGGGDTPVDPTKIETFHWGNYTGTANTTPVCIGNFTIDESMNCTYNTTIFHNMKSLFPTPTEYYVAPEHNVSNLKIYDRYYYRFSIYIKKSVNVNGYDAISWEYPNMTDCYISYELNRDTGIFEYSSDSIKTEFNVTTSKPLEKGTYYVYFSNYVGLYTYYNTYTSTYGRVTNFIKYMPWDNMSVDVTLTLEPIT